MLDPLKPTRDEIQTMKLALRMLQLHQIKFEAQRVAATAALVHIEQQIADIQATIRAASEDTEHV